MQKEATEPLTQLMVQGCLKVILGSSRCSPSSLWRSQKASADRILLVARAMSWNLCPDFEAALREALKNLRQQLGHPGCRKGF